MCSRTPRSTSLSESPPCNRRHLMPAFVPPNLVLCDRFHATKSPFPALSGGSVHATSSSHQLCFDNQLGGQPERPRADESDRHTVRAYTASTPEGLGQAAGTYTTYTGGFRTVDCTEGISEVASGPVNPTCCLNPDATAVPPSLPCLFSGVLSTPRRSLASGSAENQDGGQATNTGPGPTAGTQESTSDLRGDTPLDVDAKLAEVYGEPTVMMDETDRERATSDPWYLRWVREVRLSFRQYHLPNGNVGRKFVEMLADEIDRVAEKKSNSERLIVFQVLILQREMLVFKSLDIRRLIGRRLKMWEDGLFDALMHEAERCDRSFANGRDSKRREQSFEHTERVFHRLMIEGKVRSAVRWIAERERGGLLKATEITTITNSQGQKVEMTVLEALQRKHPEPAQPGPSLRAFLPYPEPHPNDRLGRDRSPHFVSCPLAPRRCRPGWE